MHGNGSYEGKCFTGVNNKDLFYEMYLAGVLGNRLRNWTCVSDIESEGYNGLIGVRSKVPGGICRYHQTLEQVKRIDDLDGYNLSEMAPDDKIIFQGELVLEPSYRLHYSWMQVPMRISLRKAPEWLDGLAVLFLLKRYMTPSSYDDLQELLNRFPGHVIEFGVYSCNLGIYEHRNTIIWEVRKY